MRQTPPSIWFWGSFLCLAGLTGLRLDLRLRADPPPTLTTELVAAMGLEPAGLELALASPGEADFVAAGPSLAELTEPSSSPVARSVADTLGADDSIYLSLVGHEVPEVAVLSLIQALRPVFDPRSGSRPGDSYALDLDSAGAVLHFEYSPAASPDMPVIVTSEQGRLKGQRLRLPLVERTRVVHLVIEDNLSNAVAASGESDALTDMLADVIFGSVIDFHRDPRRGDGIDLVFTKFYMGDVFVRYGRVELSRYVGQVVSHTAVYHASGAVGRGVYYDETGTSLERMFLLKPLSYRRISARFSRQRLHPILKRNRPHLGTDYAAPPGTEVMATARGRVISAGRNGGYGKMVEIEHPNGYRTRYAHLSRILVRPDQRVEKRQIIGLVGSTGLATGPHLHYELLRDGHHLNPDTANRGSAGAPLGEGELLVFGERRDALLDLVSAAGEARQVAAGDLPMER